MANIKAGIIGAIATVVLLIVELLMFPIALSFMTNLNSTCQGYNASNGVCADGGRQWITANDRATLANTPTLLVVIILFTALGGMIGSIYLAVKG